MPELTIGDFIRQKREERGVGKRALSTASGLSESYISKLEAGAMDNPSFRAISAIAVELRMSTPEIMHLIRQEAQRR